MSINKGRLRRVVTLLLTLALSLTLCSGILPSPALADDPGADGGFETNPAPSIAISDEGPVTPDVKIYLPKASQMTPSGTFITGFDAYFKDAQLEAADSDGNTVNFRRVENDGANGLPPASLIKSVFYPDNGGAPLAAGPYSYTLYKDSSKSAVYSSGGFEVQADDGTNPDINTFNFCELLLRVYPVTGYADDFLSVATVRDGNSEELAPFARNDAPKSKQHKWEYLLLLRADSAAETPYSYGIVSNHADWNVFGGAVMRAKDYYCGIDSMRFRVNELATIKVSKGAEIGVYSKNSNHFAPFTVYPLEKDVTERADGDVYDYYTGALPQNADLHYEAARPGEFKQCGHFRLTQNETVTIDLPDSCDSAQAGQNAYAWQESNIYTNLNDTGGIELSPGQKFTLDYFRVWQAMQGTTSNYFIEPEYSFTVLGDSAAIAKTGSPGRLRQEITAVQNGVSVIKFTYGPLIYKHDTSALYFGSIDPVNTGVAVINVGGSTRDFDTGITARNDFDAYYFDRAKTDHAELSFTPAEGSAVRVHDPLHISEFGEAWTDYTADADGRFTVRLREGRSIIEASNGGSVKYHVVMARGLNISAVNKTRPGAPFAVGDTAEITLDGLCSPVQKLGGIYNPGIGNVPGSNMAFAYTTHVEYTASGGTVTVESGRGQYDLTAGSAPSRIIYTITGEDGGALTGGRIYQTHFGEELGAHRSIPLTGVSPSMNARQGNNSPYFGALPDIALLGIADVGGDDKTGPGPGKDAGAPNPDRPAPAAPDKISLLVKDPKGKTYFNGSLDHAPGMTALSALTGALGEDNIGAVGHSVYAGKYVFAIMGLGEFDEGPGSGWMYRVNGAFPQRSAELYALSAGDVVEWLYTRELGRDLENAPSGGFDDKPNTGASSGPDAGGGADKSARAEVKATISGGKAAAEVKPEAVKELIGKSKEDGKTNVTLTVTNAESAKSIELALPASALGALTKSGMTLTVESDVGALTLDATTLAAIAETAKDGETVKISAEAVDSSVIELSISVGDIAITSLGGAVTVSVPYTPEAAIAEADHDLLTVYHLDDGGKKTEMKGARYDAATGKITFATTHFSKFLISEWLSPFTDIAKGDWFYKAARHAYSNDLITGTTPTTFSPQTTLTRAMLATILYRDGAAPYGTDVSLNVPTGTGNAPDGATPFTDVAPNQWYSEAITWAATNGIVTGDGDNKFAPDAPITREQFATLLYRYAQWSDAGNGRPGTVAPTDANLAAYTDAETISDWAREGMSWAVSNGLITGRTATALAPESPANRAEAAMLLQRYLQNIT